MDIIYFDEHTWTIKSWFSEIQKEKEEREREE